jgi:DNA-binding LytR/AlgR family response regulator
MPTVTRFDTIRCGIVDDKPLAVDLLRAHADQIPFLHVAFATTNPMDVLPTLAETPVDLLFLDIQMPGLTGLQLANLVDAKTRIIFTTAYADYALDGFEHSAVDYLLKPISFERFYKAVQKAREVIHQPALAGVAPPEPIRNFLFVRTEARLVKVDFTTLLYVEAMQNYCVLHTTDIRLMTLQTMKQMQEQLPDGQFTRVHKSYIVHISKIDSVERSRVFIGKAVIPVGDSYRDEFYRRLTG